MHVNWNTQPAGTCVRITGGLMGDMEGSGIGHEAPGPVPKELRGTLGQLEPFVPVNGLNLTHQSPYPLEPWRSKILRDEAEEVTKTLTAVRVIEGPLKGTLLNRDLLELDLLSPLEALAQQI